MLSLPQTVGAASGQRRVQASALNGLSAAHSLRGMPVLTASPARAAPAPERQGPALRCQAVAAPEAPTVAAPPAGKAALLHVVIAGAGIGGLLLAVGLQKKGFKVTVLERDLTAIRGEGKYRGPIQVRREGPGGPRRGAPGGGAPRAPPRPCAPPPGVAPLQ